MQVIDRNDLSLKYLSLINRYKKKIEYLMCEILSGFLRTTARLVSFFYIVYHQYTVKE